MKRLHREGFFGWSSFDEARNLDFHSLYWKGPEGGVVVDPLPLSEHDFRHLSELGGAKWVIVTNSDHLRVAGPLAHALGAQLAGPAAERERLGLPCARWLADGDEIAGAQVLELAGSKTPGELALVLEQDTLVTGDLLRAHQGGTLCLLPDAKLTDRAQAIASLRRLAELPVSAVLVGDGWPVFRDGQARLRELLTSLAP